MSDSWSMKVRVVGQMDGQHTLEGRFVSSAPCRADQREESRLAGIHVKSGVVRSRRMMIAQRKGE